MDVFKLDVGQKQALQQIINFDQEFFPYPWDFEQWKSLWDQSRYKLWGCKNNGEIIGFVLFDASQVESWHLLKIIILPRFRGSGLSRRFFNSVLKLLHEEQVQSVYLEVAIGNEVALNFYKAFGFKILVEKNKYYSDGQSAFAMQLNI